MQFFYAVCKFTVCYSACVLSVLSLSDGVYVMLRKEGVRAALFADNAHFRLSPAQGMQQTARTFLDSRICEETKRGATVLV